MLSAIMYRRPRRLSLLGRPFSTATGHSSEIHSTSRARTQPVYPAKQRASVDGSIEGLKLGPRLIGMGANEQGMSLMSRRWGGSASYIFTVKLETGSPRLDPRQVEQVLRELQELHPMLRCRIVDHNGKLFFEESLDTRIPVEVVKRDNGDDTIRDIFNRDFQRRPLSLGKDVNKVYILQDDRDPNAPQEIAFGIEHVTMDGTSTGYFVHEFFELLSGLKTKGDFPKPLWNHPMCASMLEKLNPNEKFLKNLKIQAELAAEMVGVLQHGISLNTTRLPRSKSGSHLKDSEWPLLGTTLSFDNVYTKEQTKQLRLSARKNKASITTIVAECYGRALGEREEEVTCKHSKPKRIQATFVTCARRHGREHIPGRVMTPFVGSAMVTSPELTFKNFSRKPWELAQFFKESLVQGDSRAAHRALNIHKFYRFLPTSTLVPTLTVSSWGSSSPISKKYGDYILGELNMLQNFNHLALPVVSVFPANAELTSLRTSMFAQVPYFEKEDLQWVSNRANQLLLDHARSH